MKTYSGELYSTGHISIRSIRKVPLLVYLSFFLVSGVFAGGGASAQSVIDATENPRNETAGAKADFLFKQPTRYTGFRVGEFFPQAGSDIFDMVTRELTLGKSDFRAWDIGFDLGFGLSERFDLIFRFDYSDKSNNSEFRDYVDELGRPITQKTDFMQASLTAGVKYLFAPRGRAVGQYAWLPNRFVPFVEAGVGGLWYRFEQSGNFVDYATLEIFYAYLKSSDWAPTLYMGGGVDIHLYKSSYLTLDLRYSWAERNMSGRFTGFEPIDLSGFRATTGVSFHY